MARVGYKDNRKTGAPRKAVAGAPAPRKLQDLRGIGRAMLRDFEVLGIRSVEHLAMQDPEELYERLSEMAGIRHDPCVLDSFHCAVAQARDPLLPPEQCDWWYWSRKRLSVDK